MQIIKKGFIGRNRIALSILIGLVVLVIVMRLYYDRALREMPEAPIFLSLIYSLLSIFAIIQMVAWVMAFKYFTKIVSSKKMGESLLNAKPFNSFYVFSDKYLSDDGKVARRKLFICIAIGVLAFIGGLAPILLSRQMVLLH